LPELPQFSVDGYCAETRSLQDHGVLLPRVQAVSAVSRPQDIRGDTLAERYEQTMTRIEQITKAGYTVKVIWECEFDASKIVERKPHSLTHPIVRHGPLNTSDGLYGDRTEAMILHYRIDEDAETIHYWDVMSLYPFICKYYKFPIGHPIIHVGDMQTH